MTEAEMIRLARLAIDKRWSFEQLKYGDYLYGKEHLTDEVWDFVEECREIGCTAFDLRHAAALAKEEPPGEPSAIDKAKPPLLTPSKENQ